MFLFFRICSTIDLIEEYIIINRDELLSYLESRPRPVPETDLLRRFYPEARNALKAGVSLELFRYHFLLYHSLFRLAGELEASASDYFLFIKTINVYLFRKPGPGYCRYFDPNKPGFCAVSTESPTAEYCSFHGRQTGSRIAGGTLGDADMRGYYLDLENLDRMDESRLKMWQQGLFTYAASYEEIDRCLDLFSLSPDFSLKRLKDRYRYLSKLYHPDSASGGNGPDFQEIQSAYRLLLSLKENMDETDRSE